MQRALRLARQALGTTSPNPSVGAVLVRDGVVVGEGYTLPPGQRHAEIGALEQAGPAARGASLYSTLEPCCHFGRTPPCTRAVIAAGVAEVHLAVIDPNPRVQGQGSRELEAAGIRVLVGEEAGPAGELYEAFAKHIATGLPYVSAKFAMSLDGKIAAYTGDSKWITGPEARDLVQQIRRESDAVMVGVNTVLADDPQLTVRQHVSGPQTGRQPLRVVLDSRGRTPSQARLLREPGKTLIFTSQEAGAEHAQRLTSAGAEVFAVPAAPSGMVDLGAALRELGRRGVVSLLVEGGGTLLGSLFDAGMVDKVYAFVAPVIIGGRQAVSPVAGQGVAKMAEAWRLSNPRMQPVGSDWLIVGYPQARR
ncbi:MAG: bifunctional diaminohydroxyphosphoribosylaminopyrimidine deaminase/5-amino-6-(5-phosphoribosylamino)uracil reductase RibD [Dehalococcoidia bacterium]|nr:bifunctional diaminohydroxyphosphoribosylaminopyrimidine deaminase/5-amino-6-(5-phosphoribosylamino)uracil reductase RibD [Dehalococcoidia bacterium]MSQ17272.1 bifunctional diaminohydroxyphosphoribosylaminopyrimidine deaminase/5-amino-6-(5-phosphoribosylamino)uracil reductase RibD [Dehalococcoidia bacterium]